MRQAGTKLVGEHDFRNFCKLATHEGVYNYVRKIMDINIRPLSEADVSKGGSKHLSDTEDGYAMWELTVVGTGFLWHQIRSIFTVMFLVGKGKETVQVGLPSMLLG